MHQPDLGRRIFGCQLLGLAVEVHPALIVAIALGALSGLTSVPETAAFAAAGVTLLNTIAGYLTYDS